MLSSKKKLPLALLDCFLLLTILHFAFPLFVLASLRQADLSLFVIDLKYNNSRGVKICEIQPCYLSVFRCSEGKGRKIAKRLDQLVASHWPPEQRYVLPGIASEVVTKTLVENGWKTNLPQFNQEQLKKTDYTSLTDYEGVVYSRIHGKSSLTQHERDLFPQFLFIEAISSKLILNKKQVFNLLEDHPELKKLRPLAGLYPAKFDQQIVERILKEIPSEKLVLKPIAMSKGKGVLIIPKEELLFTLYQLFGTDQLNDNLIDNKDYACWKSSHSDEFLVEEFIESEPLEISAPGLVYDPTMRVVVAITCDQQKLKTFFLGKYWKLPAFSLNQQKDLTSTHKSQANHSYQPVDRLTWEKVKEGLNPWLLRFYRRLRDEKSDQMQQQPPKNPSSIEKPDEKLDFFEEKSQILSE